MSKSPLSRFVAPAIVGAVVATAAPFVATAPASADPAVPGLGCLTNPVQTVTSTGAPQGIPDVGTATQTIHIPDGGTLSWLRVQTDLLSSHSGDLTATLTSPAGKVLTLTSGNGGNVANAFNGTWWDDNAGATNAPGSAAETAYSGPQSTLAPEEGLGALRGQSVTGDWVLTVTDLTGAGGTDTLTDWTMQYATRANGAPDVANVGTGLLPGGTVPAGTTQDFVSTLNGTPTGTLQDVVAKLDINAPSSAVKALLISPTGTTVTLTDQLSTLFPFVTPFLGGTELGDYAGLLTTSGPISDLLASLFGTLNLATPEEPLSALSGQALAGVWTLRLSAIGAPVTLNSWGLDFTGSSCGADSVLTAVTTLPSHVPAGTTFAYAVTATNARLASLAGSNLGLTLPAGLQLVDVTSTLGTCTGLTCDLGTLVPGAQGVVVYLIKAVTEGAQNLQLNLGHLGLDSTPLNNVLNLSTTVDKASVGPGPDTTAPSLVLLLSKDKLRTIAKLGLMTAFGGSEGGKLVLKVKLPGKVAKRLHLPKTIGKRTVSLSKASAGKVRVKVSKKAAKKLATSSKPVRLIVKGTLRDRAGNVGKAAASGTYKH